MGDYQFPRTPELEEAFRTAYRALAALMPPNTVTPERETSFAEVLSQFRTLVDRADLALAAQLGPRISWQAPRPDGSWELVVSGVDLDGDAHHFGDVVLGRDAFEGPTEAWHGSALDRAGVVYKRACGWDFPPGEAGVWLVMLAPVEASGGEDGLWFYSGHLAGFVVVYDRDEDDVHESIGHIWTATAFQRRGIARRLLTEAKSRFPITNVEKPYTDEGAAFLRATFTDPS
jgi:ribosomal protein S18 acetylase RimI-like enzyme